MDADEDTTTAEMLSPISAEGTEKQEERELSALAAPDLGSPSMGYNFSNIRVCGIAIYVLARSYRINCLNSSFHLHHPPSCAREVGSTVLNNPNARFTTSKSKSSTWI